MTDFQIERGPNGQPEQFLSTLELKEKSEAQPITNEISVNHPLRFKGLTIYQADWALASITIQLGNSRKLQLPLTTRNTFTISFHFQFIFISFSVNFHLNLS